MRGHVLSFRDGPQTRPDTVYCHHCEREMDLNEFLATPRCLDRGEWIAAALDYVVHAKELAAP
jgi:hypothetical protein